MGTDRNTPADAGDFDCFAEVDAASKRIAAAEKVNIWGRKRQTRDDWQPARPPREETTMARRSKLTPEQQAEAKRDWQLVGPTNLARKFGVSESCIYTFGKQHGLTCNGKRPGGVRPSIAASPASSAVVVERPTARPFVHHCKAVMAETEPGVDRSIKGPDGPAGSVAVDLGQGVSQTMQITLRISVEVIDVRPG